MDLNIFLLAQENLSYMARYTVYTVCHKLSMLLTTVIIGCRLRRYLSRKFKSILSVLSGIFGCHCQNGRRLAGQHTNKDVRQDKRLPFSEPPLSSRYQLLVAKSPVRTRRSPEKQTDFFCGFISCKYIKASLFLNNSLGVVQ